MMSDSKSGPTLLKREVGLFGAVMMGLGSIIGTGVFVSIGIAAGAAGPAVILAISVAAVVAVCNGLSSAQLAANHPVSGGTYEYGYRWLRPAAGFTAGWMFLCAKSASAATAALGFSGYFLHALMPDRPDLHVPIALATVLLLTILVLFGMRASNYSNIAVVSVTLFALVGFVLAGLPTALTGAAERLTPFFAPVAASTSPAAGFLEACALMFVAYTGYGRIATLAEEVHEPRRTIPRALIIALAATMVLYVAVGFVAVASVGSEAFSTAGTKQAAPLEVVARQFDVPGAATVVAIGAMTAMLGVLLNLILGLSRVVLAMARRRDLPQGLAELKGTSSTPQPAIILVGILIAGLAMIGDVKTTWSFSAFSVLIYYAITNLAAMRLSEAERRFPRPIPWLGVASCLFLAFWVERMIWMVGLGLIAAGLIWRLAAARLRSSP